MGRAAHAVVRQVRDKGLVDPRDEELVVPKIPLLLIALVALAFVAGSSASPTASPMGPPEFVVGATEDQALGFDDGGASLYRQMRTYGLGAIRMSVDYEPTAPTVIQQRAHLERAINAATEGGVRVMLSVSPGHNTDVTGEPNGARKFATYIALVAREFPSVTDFVIGNEPNLGNFWFPTYNKNGTIASAATYEAALAASYDALKDVNPEINVIGLAVSPKGDDRPGSARNTISPVRFIKAVGDAYRKSRRTEPIMDNVALHPYPFSNLDPPEKGAAWPNVSVANLDRAQQAFWDGFNGTGQPTFEETGLRGAQAGPAVRWILDEAGWQSETRGLSGYFGSENTPPVDETTQGRYYKTVVQRFACDPHVAALLFFHWIDEADRDRLQSGLVRANKGVKPAASMVRDAIGNGCTGGQVGWRHSMTVDGASATWKPKNGFLFTAKAFEEATFVAKATPKTIAVKRAKLLGKKLKAVTVKGTLKAYLSTGIKFKGIRFVNSGNYTYNVKITAAMNAKRTVTLKTKKIKSPDIEA
jgi:hypothetical protein